MSGPRRLLLCCICALFPGIAFADLKALEAAARKEGELTWYTSHYNQEVTDEVARGFVRKHNVKVNVVRASSQAAYQRLRQDIKNNARICDVFASTDVGHFVDLKREARLERYVPEQALEAFPEFRSLDPEGFYHATSVGLVVLIFNTQRVKAADAPRSWPESLQFKWQRQIASGHPAFSGYAGIWVVQMRKMYGWQFFEKLETLSPQIGRSMQDAVGMVASGERAIGYTAEAAALASVARGEPVGIVYPVDGAVLAVAASAVMKSARHPSAARLFLEYLYSVEAAAVQAAHFASPLRSGTPRPSTMKSPGDIKIVRPSVAELVEQVPEIIERWRDTFGN